MQNGSKFLPLLQLASKFLPINICDNELANDPPAASIEDSSFLKPSFYAVTQKPASDIALVLAIVYVFTSFPAFFAPVHAVLSTSNNLFK